VAYGFLAGLGVLSVVLIARGPQASYAAAPSAATLTSGDLAGAAPRSSASASAAPAPAGAAPPATPAAAAPAAPFVPTWRVSSLKHDAGIELLEGTIGKRTLERSLMQAGLARSEARKITHATSGIRRISDRSQPKDAFVVAKDRAKGSVVAFEYVTSPTDIWQAKVDQGWTDGRLAVRKLELFVDKKRAAAALVVTSDLAHAVTAANLREGAAADIDDALDGHVDLLTLKPGVRMRVAYHEEWVEGAFARLQLDAIEYVPKVGAALRIYQFERDPSAEGSRRHAPHPGFYDAKGQQPFRGTFRSPVPLARVTSRFNPKRMHPVLHVVMPHNGVDFGAGTGTPVYAAAAGTVQSAGDGGACGNMVQIDHAGGLTTAYCHLSRFAPGVHGGTHVEARQLVGYVGQTGRATGPHLHFAVKRGATFIDPLAIKMDGVRTIPPSDRDQFAKRRVELDGALDGITLPPVDGAALSAPDDDRDEPAGEE